MTNEDREGWFRSGSLFLLVFFSYVWKASTLLQRLFHAAVLLAIFFAIWGVLKLIGQRQASRAAADGDEE